MKQFFSKSGLIILFMFIYIPVNLSAADLTGSSAALSVGLTVDIAPYGVEQVYAAVAGEYFLPGNLSLGVKPSLAFNNASFILRVPVAAKLRLVGGEKPLFNVSGYCGVGAEFYKSSDHELFSPILTGGVRLELQQLYVDIPVVTAFRDYDTDSDLSVTAGVSFAF